MLIHKCKQTSNIKNRLNAFYNLYFVSYFYDILVLTKMKNVKTIFSIKSYKYTKNLVNT